MTKDASIISRTQALVFVILCVCGTLVTVYADLYPFLLVLAVAPLASLILARNPRVWLYCTAIILPVFVTASDEGVSAMDVVMGVFLLGSLACWLVVKLLTAPDRVIRNSFDVFLLLYILVLLGSIGVAASHGTRVLDSLRMCGLGCLILYYFPLREYFNEKKYLLRLASILTLGVLAIALYSISEYRSVVHSSEYAFQIAGRRLVPHVYLAAAIFSLLFTTRRRITFRRLGAVAVTGVILVGLATTYARTTWFAFLIMMIVSLFFTSRQQRVRSITLVVSIALITFASLSLVFGRMSQVITKVVANRFTSAFNVKFDPALGNRRYESKAVSKLVWQEPVSGYGLATKFQAYDGYTVSSTRRIYIHNGVLASLYSFGIAGAVVQFSMFGVAIGRAFWNVRRLRTPFNRTLALGSLLSLAAMFIENLTASIFFFRGAVFVLAICIAVSEIARNLEEKVST